VIEGDNMKKFTTVIFLVITLFLPALLEAQEMIVQSAPEVIGLQDAPSKNKRYYKRSKWSYSFFSFLSAPYELPVKDRTSLIDSYNYISFNYKIDYTKRVSIRPTFNMNTTGYDSILREDKPSKIEVGDIYLQYADYNFALLPGNIGVLAQFRLFLPTSESSREQKTLAKLGGWFIFSRPFGDSWELNFHTKGYFYWQSQKSYDGGKSYPSHTKKYKWENYFEFGKMFNEKFGFSTRFGLKMEEKHGSSVYDSEPRHTNTLITGLSFRYNYAWYLNFIFGISNEIYNVNNQEDRTPLQPEDLEFILLTFFRF
jgi:hypothetical protein